MYSLEYIVVAALVSHAPISALKEYALSNTIGVVVVVVQWYIMYSSDRGI